jgi:archaemetzincin
MNCLYMGATPELISAAEREAFAGIGPHLAREFHVPVLPIELPPIDFAYDSARAQYASIPVLEMLLRRCPGDGARLLAVTTRDLFIPVLTFVFGHAQLGGRAGIVSLARLRQEFYGLPPDQDIFMARAAKEAVHETGHLYGLVHCTDRACAMSLSTGVLRVDSKTAHLCPSCAARVRRLTAAHSETRARKTRFPSPDAL